MQYRTIEADGRGEPMQIWAWLQGGLAGSIERTWWAIGPMGGPDPWPTAWRAHVGLDPTGPVAEWPTLEEAKAWLEAEAIYQGLTDGRPIADVLEAMGAAS